MAPPVPSSIPSLHAFDPQSTSWKSYRDRIQFYFEANRIVEVKEKKALFLWSIGNATYQLLENLISPQSLTNADVQFEDLLQILNTHYDDTKNIMTSTYDFYSCLQKEGQPFGEWKAELCEKLRHCGFTTSNLKDKPQDRALRDMYVIGVRNPKIRQALLKEQDPDLEKAEKIIQLAERLYEDVQHFGNPSVRVDGSVAKIHHQQPKQFSNRPSKQNNNKNNNNNDPCATCGSTEHIRETCKYRNYTCNYCKRSGHLARVCRSRPKEKEDELSVKHVTATIFKLDHVDRVTQSPVFTTATPLRINGHDCPFELDTGALHTIITVNDWNKIGTPIIRASNLHLKSFGGTSLEIKGECTVNVEYQRQMFTLPAVIVNESGPSLLGLQWIHHLHLDLNSIIYGNNYITHGTNYSEPVDKIYNQVKHIISVPRRPVNNQFTKRIVHSSKPRVVHEQQAEQINKVLANKIPFRSYRRTSRSSNRIPRMDKPLQRPIRTEFVRLKSDQSISFSKTINYSIGQLVWSMDCRPNKRSYWQPAIITKHIGPIVYEIQLKNGQHYQRHQNQLRPRFFSKIQSFDIDSLPDELLKNNLSNEPIQSAPETTSRYLRRNRRPPDRYSP